MTITVTYLKICFLEPVMSTRTFRFVFYALTCSRQRLSSVNGYQFRPVVFNVFLYNRP